jgi:hypothetical protein
LTLSPSNRHATVSPDTERQRAALADDAGALMRRIAAARIQPLLDRHGIAVAA